MKKRKPREPDTIVSKLSQAAALTFAACGRAAEGKDIQAAEMAAASVVCMAEAAYFIDPSLSSKMMDGISQWRDVYCNTSKPKKKRKK